MKKIFNINVFKKSIISSFISLGIILLFCAVINDIRIYMNIDISNLDVFNYLRNNSLVVYYVFFDLILSWYIYLLFVRSRINKNKKLEKDFKKYKQDIEK